MVYYDTRKHRGRRQANKPKAPRVIITDLPDELLIKIFEDVPTADILTVRALGGRLLPACTDTLQHRLKVLYIHPKSSHLKKAVAICNSGLASKVEVICLLGHIPWQAMIKMIPDVRQRASLAGVTGVSALSHPWTNQPSGQSSNVPSGKGPHRRFSSDAFAVSYEELLTSLVKLPNVKALRFHDQCDEPGFNQLSDIDRRVDAASCATQRLTIDRITKVRSMGHAFTDADAVFALLRNLNHLTSLEIKEELPFSKAPRSYLDLGSLTTLELHCSAGWQNSSWQKTCSRIVQDAHMVQNLCLMFQHNAAVHGARIEGSLQTIIEYADLLAVRKLRIVALLPPSENGRTWRPLLQLVDFPKFLATHAGLTDVKLENVIFVDQDLLHDVSTAFGKVMETTNPDMAFEWVVNRFDRDPRCGKGDTSIGHACRYDCFRYCPPGLGDLRLQDLDSYMEVCLGEETEQDYEFWDVARARKFEKS